MIIFDPVKDQSNRKKYGLSLADAALIEWEQALEWQDSRRNYGERRMVALAPIGERLYCCVYVVRDRDRRILSLRKANQREFDYDAKNLD